MAGSRFPLFAVLATALAMSGGLAQASEPLKVGFIYVSPIGDAGWTFQHETGRRQMAAALADKPGGLIARVKEKEDAIRSSSFHPIQGPVKDQAGEVRIAAGTTISDADLQKMEWYVQGVQGKLPG